MPYFEIGIKHELEVDLGWLVQGKPEHVGGDRTGFTVCVAVRRIARCSSAVSLKTSTRTTYMRSSVSALCIVDRYIDGGLDALS